LSDLKSKFGTILKRETLSNAPLPFSSKYLILHSSDPFPGFYCSEENPTDNSCKEFSYYIPFKNSYFGNEELLCRISLEIQAELSIKICPAVIRTTEENIRAFRVKEIEVSQLNSILTLLTEKNIILHKNKTTKSFLGHIHLKGFFELRQISEGIYENTDSKGLYYLTIPESLDWKIFENIITYQKSNSKFRNFDAAIGYWVEKPSFYDFLRIYGTNLELRQLIEIHKEFLRNLKKHNKQGILI